VQNREDDDGELTDYTEEDFKDLMSQQQVLQSIKVYFDRLKELINPIDDQRLQLDSVHQVKQVVKDFYRTKHAQCMNLLSELDKMNTERSIAIRQKREYFNKSQEGHPVLKNHDQAKQMKELRLQTQL
jgi:hypothetical protein